MTRSEADEVDRAYAEWLMRQVEYPDPVARDFSVQEAVCEAHGHTKVTITYCRYCMETFGSEVEL